jgi:hypothetical protein
MVCPDGSGAVLALAEEMAFLTSSLLISTPYPI